MTKIVEGSVQSVDHVSASHAGNPTYRVILTDGQSFLTATDYGIPAGNFRPHSLNLPVSPVVLEIGARGRIVKMHRPNGWVDPRDGSVRCDCGHTGKRDGIGTGYAELPDGRKLCYSCADDRQREEMHNAREFVAYVNGSGNRLTTWSGGHLAMNTGHTESRGGGWHNSNVHRWWFTDRNGGRWFGMNGGPGEVIKVRRIKGGTPAVAASEGRDEVTADVDPDKHRFSPDMDDETVCAFCGDNEGANDHLDRDDPNHVWMDIEGLTAGDIDRLDALTSDIADEFDGDLNIAARMVADWIGGVLVNSVRSEVLADPEAIDGLRAFTTDVLTEREDAGDLSRFGGYYNSGYNPKR